MTGYKIVRLCDMLNELGEESTSGILSSFSSPLNKDVEQFITQKKFAIDFDKQAISRTNIVVAPYKGNAVIVGYFTLALKEFSVNGKNTTATLRRKLNKYGVYIPEISTYRVSAPLIAQLSKNFTNGYNELIKGDELLAMALERVEAIQLDIGGKIVYVECEDKEALLSFYERHGFKEFSKRPLDKDEKDLMEGHYLVQLLRHS